MFWKYCISTFCLITLPFRLNLFHGYLRNLRNTWRKDKKKNSYRTYGPLIRSTDFQVVSLLSAWVELKETVVRRVSSLLGGWAKPIDLKGASLWTKARTFEFGGWSKAHFWTKRNCLGGASGQTWDKFVSRLSKVKKLSF